jgi:hypothetical protein
VRLITSVAGADPDCLLSAVGLEVTEAANLAAMMEDRGAKWYVISGWRLELSLLSCVEGGESER